MSSADPEMQSLQFLRAQFSQALKDFANPSSPSFRILHTIPPISGTSQGTPLSTRTLYVLDSSFNPPSKAHSSLVKTALKSSSSHGNGSNQENIPRVLFLLATVNADKKPKPADFEDRIVMMTLAAQDLRASFSPASSSSPSDLSKPTAPIIDIGITKLPYFVDKARSIASSKSYAHPDREDGVTQQIHLTGFDTLLRIFAPKYYPDHDPPLSALEPFLNHHRVRATIRVDPTNPSENLRDAQRQRSAESANEEATEQPDLGTIAGQRRYLESIKGGSLEAEGMKSHWADQVDLVIDDTGDADGVSSTKVRDAVKGGNWDEVQQLVGPDVGHWIRENGLYLEKQGEGGGEL